MDFPLYTLWFHEFFFFFGKKIGNYNFNLLEKWNLRIKWQFNFGFSIILWFHEFFFFFMHTSKKLWIVILICWLGECSISVVSILFCLPIHIIYFRKNDNLILGENLQFLKVSWLAGIFSASLTPTMLSNYIFLIYQILKF